MPRNIPSNEKQMTATNTLFFPARLSFKMEGKIMSSPDKIRLKGYITKPALQEMLKGML